MLSIWLIILAALLVFAGVIIASVIYRKRLNKRLSEDRETLAAGGVPSNAGRHEFSGWEVLSVSIAIIAFAVSLFVFGITQTNRIQQQIQSSNNNVNSKMNQMLYEIKEMKNDQKKAQSILSSISVYTLGDGWNEEDMTVHYRVDIVPKQVSSDTSVTLNLDGRTYETVREGSIFSTLVDKKLFIDKRDTEEQNIYVSVISDGVSANEVLTTEDTSIYLSLGNLFYPDWLSFFPHFEDKTWIIDHRTVPELEKNAISIDWWMNAELKKGVYDIADCSIRLYDGDRVLFEQNLTDQLVSGAKEGTFEIEKIKIEGSWKNIKSDYVYLEYSVTDSKGYTYSTYEYFAAAGKDITHLPYERLTDSDGTVIY